VAVDIRDPVDGTAVEPDPAGKLARRPHTLRKLYCGSNRCHRIAEKDQRHTVAGGKPDQVVAGGGSPDVVQFLDQLLKPLHGASLLFHAQA
jgi:hypothetical protein